MANEIRTALVIDLEGNIETKAKEVEGAIDGVGKQAKSTGNSFKSFFDKSVSGFGRVKDAVFSLKGMLAGLGIGVAVTRSLDEADKIQKLTQKLGDSAERISAMRHVADGAGIDFDQMMTSWQRMGRRISEVATSGTGPAAEALERLKLSADALANLPPTDQFLSIADAMTRIATAGEKMDLAQAIFDSEGVANLQAMQNGAQGIVTAMDEARQLGFVLTQQQVDQAARANDAIARVTNAISGAFQTIAVEFAPHIERFAGFLTSAEGLAAIQTFASGLGWLATNLDSIAQVIALVMAASSLPALIGLLSLGVPGLIITGFVALAAAIVTFRDEIGAAWEAVRDFEIGIGPFKTTVGGMVDGVIGYFSDLATAIRERIGAWREFASAVASVGEEVIGYVTDMIDGIKQQLIDRFNGIVDSIGDAVDSVSGFFKDMWDKVTGHSYVPDMVDGIESEFNRLPDVMVDPAERATSAVSGFFEDLGRKVGSTIRDVLTGTTSLKDGLKSLVSDIGEMIQTRLVDATVDGLFGLLPGGIREFLGVGGGSDGIGRHINGGGIGGGGIGGGFVAKLGKEIGTAIGNGSGLIKGISTGIGNAFSGINATAAGNLGFKGPAAFATQAQAAGSAGFGAGIGWSGVAVPLAIGAYGFGVQARKRAQRRERQQEFFQQVGTGTSEQLGDGAWDFRGMLDDANAFFSTTREGWRSTIEALSEANLVSEGWGAMLDENGRGLVKIRGDIDGVKNALSNAVATGYSFSGSLTNAIEKGNNLRVSIQGDADEIRNALNAATAAGIGGFVGLEKTATGVSATLTGDIRRWDQFLQSFVNNSIQAAVSGVSSIGSAAGQATSNFIKMASAARSATRAASSVRGGRSTQVDAGFAFGGISRGPQLAWVSEGPYPIEAHVPMADGHHIPVRVSGGVPSAPTVVDLDPVVNELRAVRADLDRVVGRPITRSIDRTRRRAAATARKR